jgi:hypothetical protein
MAVAFGPILLQNPHLEWCSPAARQMRGVDALKAQNRRLRRCAAAVRIAKAADWHFSPIAGHTAIFCCRRNFFLSNELTMWDVI